MKVDVRTKLLIVAILSLFALIYQDLVVLAGLFLLSIAILLAFRVPLRILGNMKYMLFFYLGLILMQSFFVHSGKPLLRWGDLYLLTTDGVFYGATIFFRFSILALSGLLLVTCPGGDLVLALVKMKVPGEIILMIQIGIRFLPVLKDELQNTLAAIQLRGVDLKKVYKRKVIKVYVSLFSPIIYMIYKKAEKLSILLELRGFRKYEKRTYYRDISFSKFDYFLIILTIIISSLIIIGAERYR